MTTWNNRVVRRKHVTTRNGKEHIEYTYGIHEVYYDSNGKAGMLTTEPKSPFSETAMGLLEAYEMQAEAFNKPILDFDAIPEEGYDEHCDDVFGDLETEEEFLANLTAEELKKIDEENAAFDKEMEEFDSDAYYREQEELRVKSEEEYNKRLNEKEG